MSDNLGLHPDEAEIERLRADIEEWKSHHQAACLSVAKLRADNAMLNKCIDAWIASDAKLRAALEPFVRNVNAQSLSKALGHIERRHLWDARNALERAAFADEGKKEPRREKGAAGLEEQP